MKKIISSVLAGVMLLSATPAFANDINITIDNEEFIPKNALGEVVSPFIENGSTYLPVRAMGEAVGKEVAFDAENYAVYIGIKPMAADVTRTPVAMVGDRVFYEDDLELYGSLDMMIEAEKIFTLAEEKFSEEELGLMMNEFYAFMPQETLNALSHNEYMLNEYIEFMSCVSLLQSNVVIDDSAYENYVTVKHILVDDKAKADEVLAKLENGEDFDSLIEDYNIDPGQSKDSAYTFTYGEMVEEFEKAAFEMEEGTYTKEAVATNYGYHIIKKLPLDKESVDTSSLVAALIDAELSEISFDKVVEITREGEYGTIEGFTITTDDLMLMGGSAAPYSDTFELLSSLVQLKKMFISENLVTEEDKAGIAQFVEESMAELGEVEDTEKYEFLIELTGYYSLFYNKLSENKLTDEMYDKMELMAVDSTIFKELKVFVDGQLIVPGDVNNNYVAPKNIDGTVYVPVRAIVEALGMTADWDNDTRTVVITK